MENGTGTEIREDEVYARRPRPTWVIVTVWAAAVLLVMAVVSGMFLY